MSDEEYEFEYSDEEPNDDNDILVRIQNDFYAAKGQRGEDDSSALAGFQHVLTLVAEADASAKGAELGEWHFKALKNIIKIKIRMGDVAGMLGAFAILLESINGGAVTRNRAEKAINGILDLVSSSAAIDSATLQGVYTTTLTALTQSAGNERLSFKIRIKLAKLFLFQGDWKHLKELLNELVVSLTTTRSGDVIDERSKGTQLMEVYALQIQMYTAMNDIKRLSDAYRKALSVSKAAVPHPGITGIIYECGGKMYMQERDWDSSRLQFLEAFKAYDEAGQTNKTLACLKYMLLANMLSASRINPFDSQEAKAYEKDPSIAAMTQLTDAYLANDIAAFEPILKRHSTGLAADDFMRTYLDDLMTTIRTQVLLALVAPYSRLNLSFIASELSITVDQVETLLVSLIHDRKLDASIDQVAGVLVLGSKPTVATTLLAGNAAPATARATTKHGPSKFVEVEKLASRLASLLSAMPQPASATQWGDTAGFHL